MLTAEMMICPHRVHFMKPVYGAPICQALDKRSTDGSQGGSGREIAGLVVGVIGVLLTALTVFKGWECWKLRRDQRDLGATQDDHPPPPASANSHPPTTTVTVNFNYYLTPSHLHPEIPASHPRQDIPLQPSTPQLRPSPPPVPSLMPFSHGKGQTGAHESEHLSGHMI